MALRERGVVVFYDRFREAEAWGKNLDEYLHDVYSSRCRYCVVFISKAYLTSEWTRLERRSAQDSARRMESEYILPVRIDDTPVPGLLSSVCHLDLRELSAARLVDLVCEKLGLEGPHERCKSDRLIFELRSDQHFAGDQAFADMDMHNLHQTVVELFGGKDCSIVGCTPQPHRLQLNVRDSTFQEIRAAFLDGSLNKLTGVEWLEISRAQLCDEMPPPRQIPFVSSAGGVRGDQMVCHADYISGLHDEAVEALEHLGGDSVSDFSQLRAYVTFLDDLIYFHSNFKKPGYARTTKISCDHGAIDLFDFFLNAVFTSWPSDEELLEAKLAHEEFAEYYVRRGTMKSYSVDFFRGAQNVRFVEPSSPVQ